MCGRAESDSWTFKWREPDHEYSHRERIMNIQRTTALCLFSSVHRVSRGGYWTEIHTPPSIRAGGLDTEFSNFWSFFFYFILFFSISESVFMLTEKYTVSPRIIFFKTCENNCAWVRARARGEVFSCCCMQTLQVTGCVHTPALAFVCLLKRQITVFYVYSGDKLLFLASLTPIRDCHVTQTFFVWCRATISFGTFV